MPRPEYVGPAWQRIRRAVLIRDGYVCQIQLAKCKGRATEVDHIVSIANGGARLDPANLRAACKSCNISKRNSEVAARARANESRDRNPHPGRLSEARPAPRLVDPEPRSDWLKEDGDHWRPWPW